MGSIDLTKVGVELVLIFVVCLAMLLTKIREVLWDVLKDKNKLFVLKARNNATIADILTEVRSTLSANRGCIYEFSNTKQSVTGIGFQFVNLTCETTDLHTGKIAAYFKEEHVANYPVMFNKLSQSDTEYVLHNITDVNIHPEIKAMMTMYGIRTMLMFKLVKSEIVHGLIGVHWSYDYYRADEIEVNVNELSDEDVYLLRNSAHQIMKLKAKPKWYQVLKFGK